MKTDRLYALTLYLLNHGRTSSSELAKQDYMKYKLVRMENVYTTEDKFSREHMSAEQILNDCDNSYKEKDLSTKVKMRCRGNAMHRIKEYLNGQLIESFEDGTAIMEIHVVENEQWWIGVVLSQGKEVEIMEPLNELRYGGR